MMFDTFWGFGKLLKVESICSHWDKSISLTIIHPKHSQYWALNMLGHKDGSVSIIEGTYYRDDPRINKALHYIGWDQFLKDLESFNRKHRKPILFQISISELSEKAAVVAPYINYEYISPHNIKRQLPNPLLKINLKRIF